MNNGLPQGSVLVPVLFNIYTSDMNTTIVLKFIYADDTVLVTQAKSFGELETILNADLKTIQDYFECWMLKSNPHNTISARFHLNNKQAQTQLDLTFCNTPIRPEIHPSYLGVQLDRSLTYRPHLKDTAAKVRTRVNLISRLAGIT